MMKQFYVSIIFLGMLCLSTPAEDDAFLKQLKGKQVAVTAFATNKDAERFQRTAQTRFETILLDNEFTPLDSDKVRELKDVWKRLEDPGYFVSAEDFVDNADKYDIQGLARIYLSVDVAPGMDGSYCATAQADIRFVNAKAKIDSDVSTPMGVPGTPPSDGLTKASAALNAIQRAIDSACIRLGLDVIDPAQGRAISLKLEGPVNPPERPDTRQAPDEDASLAKLAKLESGRWKKEKVTRTVRASGTTLAAVAGYITDIDIRRRPRQMYGSRIHVVNLKSQKEVHVLECYAASKKANSEKGSRQVLDCMFLSSWRYLAAVTGSDLFLWDTERGRLLSTVSFSKPVESAVLDIVNNDDGSFLIVDQKKSGVSAYKILIKR